jgi:hypothetical protein
MHHYDTGLVLVWAVRKITSKRDCTVLLLYGFQWFVNERREDNRNGKGVGEDVSRRRNNDSVNTDFLENITS